MEIVRINCLVPYQILECRHPATVEVVFILQPLRVEMKKPFKRIFTS